MNVLTIGNVEIVAITDLDVLVGMPLSTVWPDVPSASWEPYQARYPHVFHDAEHWHNHVGCFAVRSFGRTILIDTGIGPQPLGPTGPHGKLVDVLATHGITPADVDVVFITHLHFDHVGWNLDIDGAPYFPNARYVMSRTEWDARPAQSERATALGQPPYIERCVTPLDGQGIMDLIDGEHVITPELTAISTPGHSPGHMSVFVSSSGERAMILGDVLLHPAQVTEPDWSSRMDMDRALAAQTRRRVVERAEAADLTLAAGHIRSTPFGRVVRVDGRRYWQAVP